MTTGRRHRRWVEWVVAVLAVVAALVWTAAVATPEGGRLTVSMLDVGEGDAILVTGPAGHHVLIDGGPSPETLCLELGEVLPFWERTVELVVLTHPHEDHVCGLVEVLRRYSVERVLYPEGVEYHSNAYSEWLDVVDQRGIERVPAQAGQQVELGGGAVLEVIHPSLELLEGTDTDVDNNGVIVRIEMGDVSFLLAADLFADGERYLVERGVPLESTVLKVGHHGSKTSTSPGFLAAVDPQVAAISVSADNTFGHPGEDVMARLEDQVGADGVYITSENGTVTFTTDGTRLWVETER